MELIQKIAALRKTAVSTRPEKIEIKFATPASGAGNVGITLPDLATVNISVASSDTPAQLATKVGAAMFTGWTVAVKSGETATVVFTKSPPGFVIGEASVTPNATGVTVTANYPKIVQEGHPAHEWYNLGPQRGERFPPWCDGHFGTNSLRETAGRTRMIAYNVEQTDNSQIHYKRLGADSLLQQPLPPVASRASLTPRSWTVPARRSTSSTPTAASTGESSKNGFLDRK